MTPELKEKIGKIEKSKREKKFNCLCNNCTSMSIGSHSQQRGGQLKIISKNDFVYALNFNLYDVIRNSSDAMCFIKTPIKNASIYPGFCQNHDGQVFKVIEKRDLEQNNKEQAAAFFLRTITYEITRKKLAVFMNNELLNKCYELLPDALIKNVNLKKLGQMKFIDNDAKHYLKTAFEYYKKPHSKLVETKWVVIPKTLKASCCTVFSPLTDPTKKIGDALGASYQAITTFNLVPTIDKTHVVVSWLSEHEHQNKWIRELMDTDIEQFINYIAICESEDTCLGPDLWQSIDVFTREKIHNLVQHEIYRGPITEIPRIIKI